jgi:plastocyanin
MYVAGDFSLLPSEVTPALQTLVSAGFHVTAIGSPIINESPQLTEIQFSTTGNLYAILHVLKTVLAQTTILGQYTQIPLTIATQDASGNAIAGLFQVEIQNGTTITDVGFSPVTFSLASGHTYQIMADDYGQYTFSHWADTGSTNRLRTVSITSATQLVAVYNVGTPATSSTVSPTTVSTTITTSSSSSTSTSSSSYSTTSTGSTGSITPTMVVMPQNVGADQSLNFQPSTITVVVGVNNTITFVDQDSQSGAPHNVTWVTVPSGATVSNSPIIMTAGQTFTITLSTPGTYTYVCTFHSAWMKGTVIVKS